MAPDLKFLSYGTYVWVPVAAGLVWLADLVALFVLWKTVDNSQQYRPTEPTIVFISDVGAAHKTLFIIMNAFTWALFVLSMLCERWLRHVDRIPVAVRSIERSLDIAAIVFAFIGGGALTLLAIFDAFNHSTAHWSLTVVFIIAVALCAICQTGEIWSLHKDHEDRPHLLRNAAFKLLIVVVAILGAIAFAGLYGTCRGPNGIASHGGACVRYLSAAAVLEWSIALLFDAFLFTLALDLWPAAKTSPRHQRRVARREAQMREKGLLGPDDSPSGSAPGSVHYAQAPAHGSTGYPQMAQV